MGDNCPDSCKHEHSHWCQESGTHCETHCICPCHLCVEERGKHLPVEVREKIIQIWAYDVQHAAKQAFCFYLDRTKAFSIDHDLVVNVGLKTGMLAERMRKSGPEAFIRVFEDSVLSQ